MTCSGESVLDVRGLRIAFRSGNRRHEVVHGVDFTLKRGETLAIVGESGAGKSVTGLAITQLFERREKVILDGRIIFQGRDLLSVTEKEMRSVRGRQIAMVFQSTLTSLNPFLRISAQLIETTRLHLRLDRKAARERAIEMLELVGIEDAKSRIDSYPHEFSGGMRQRVMIAMALSCEPEILIADEPTTALDPVTREQIVQLLASVQERTGIAILLITHDIDLAARMSHYVAVMKNGFVVESARTAELLRNPGDPYTQTLLSSYHSDPFEGGEAKRNSAQGNFATSEHLLSVRSLNVSFKSAAGRPIQALENINLEVMRGEIFGMVGESGSGKTTVGRAILQLIRPTSGEVLYRDGSSVIDLARLPLRSMTNLRRQIQMIFQDPYSSLNPRMTVAQTLSEPLGLLRRSSTSDLKKRVSEVMDLVELDGGLSELYPHQLSGGQRQRVLNRSRVSSSASIVSSRRAAYGVGRNDAATNTSASVALEDYA